MLEQEISSARLGGAAQFASSHRQIRSCQAGIAKGRRRDRMVGLERGIGLNPQKVQRRPQSALQPSVSRQNGRALRATSPIGNDGVSDFVLMQNGTAPEGRRTRSKPKRAHPLAHSALKGCSNPSERAGGDHA
jgi:hypothetical protein